MRPAALAVAIAACAGAPRAFTPADDQAVRSVLIAQQTAWNRHDIEGYLAGYDRSPDIVFTAVGQVRHGFEETAKQYRTKYADPKNMGHLDFELLQVQSLGADGAIVLGTWKLSDTPLALHGTFSVALVRGADGWHIVHDHTTVVTP